MVIISLFGGLGNQMFQYALGRHLAYKLNTDLKFDISINLERTDFHSEDIPFLYDIFPVKGAVADQKEINKFKIKFESTFLKRNFKSINEMISNFYIRKKGFIKESFYQFDKNILAIKTDCYLVGYWQSEKYFKDIEEIIRDDFRFISKNTAENAEITDKINLANSVSIHLRGMDFVKKDKIRKRHYICDHEYYKRCIDYIVTKLKDPIFFIFSDDIEWAQEFLKIELPHFFIKGNSWNKNQHEDLRMMSLCKHNIIANSSFSWWAAWLNENKQKIVLAPKRWVNDQIIDTKDLIPEKWIKM